LRVNFRNYFLLSILLVFCLGIGMALPAPAPAATAHKKASSGKRHASSKHRRTKKVSWKRKGQQGIKPERATEIQEALIREHYLTGDPSGVWDARTQAAMQKFQEDNGWQNKVTPDSRALIKLGLGPNYSGATLLNPESLPEASAPISARAGSVPSSSGANQDK
jgi:peptidoglycan hydrolase-like protein with peptidoglycan-binding domain